MELGVPGYRATPQAQRSPLPCRDYASLYSRSNHTGCLWCARRSHLPPDGESAPIVCVPGDCYTLCERSLPIPGSERSFSLWIYLLFTLAPIGVVIPIVSTIITAAAPEAHFGAVLGIVVAVLILPGIIAPLVTGLLIQSSGKKRGGWISQCVPVSKPATPGVRSRLSGMCKAR